MSEPPLCKYLSPITIVSGVNDTIRILEGSTYDNVAVAEGTYYISNDGSSTDLLEALATAFEYSPDTWPVSLTSENKVQIKCTVDAWEIFWDHANTTFNGTILGIADLSASFSGAADTYDYADYRCQHTWWSTCAAAVDLGPEPSFNIVHHEADDGETVHSVQVRETAWVRTVVHEWEEEQAAKPVDGYQNQDWESFLLTCDAGETIRYHPDVSETSAYEKYTTPQGYQELVLVDLEAATPKRHSRRQSYWHWTNRMRVVG